MATAPQPASNSAPNAAPQTPSPTAATPVAVPPLSRKLRTEISWWLPGKYRLVYSGSPKPRSEWVRLTWRGYIAAWHAAFLIACFLIRKAKPPLSVGNIAKIEGLMDAYPNAYEDNHGTIWVSEEASHQETDSYQDAWVEDVLGWDWEDAYENFSVCQRVAKRKAFWKAHPRLWRVVRFLRRRRNFVMMFSGIVWRDWYGRISWSTAWKISKDTCL